MRPQNEMNCQEPRAFIDLTNIVIARVAYASGKRQPKHSHPGTNVTLVYRGSLAETVGSECEEAGPLSVVVKPEDTEHANWFGPQGALTLRLWLSPAFVSDLVDWETSLATWRWIHGGPTVRQMLRLLAFTLTRRRADGQAEDLVYDVLGTLGGSCRPRREPPPWLTLAKACLHDRFASGVRVRDIAAEAGVHPVVLARGFRRHFGSSVTGFTKQLRVRRAAELMQTSESPLSRIAYRAGYADQAHMCRDFKSLTGMTPLAFRRLV